MTALPKLPPRRNDSHKGDFGRVLIVGGSWGMSGAVGLAGMAALRTGAGLVTLAVPQLILPIVAAYEPSYMTLGLAADQEGRIAAESSEKLEVALSHATCVAIGPGLGRSPALTELVGRLNLRLSCPLVIDADGLHAIAVAHEVADTPEFVKRRGAGSRIFTPHPGEFRSLAGERYIGQPDCERARRLAADWRSIIVLKGVPTWVTDGASLLECSVGNPGMATGGSGDVLTGVITGLLAQGLSPLEAAHLGVHIHGWAGDLAAAELGQAGMIASDLLKYLPAAVRRAGSENSGS